MGRLNDSLFDFIAPVYGIFYRKQKKNFKKVIHSIHNELPIESYNSIIDIGCGTGALCSILNETGLSVTGIDSAKKMLNIAKKKTTNQKISFIQANVLERLPFEDNSFDIAIASYVAHGLSSENRAKMYTEMSRIARQWVIIHDFNDNRALHISIIERLEGSDYFYFIREGKAEIESHFSEIKVIEVSKRAIWYICKPANNYTLKVE